jgi:hypothetical protein
MDKRIAPDLSENVSLRYLPTPVKLTKIIPHSRVYLDLDAHRMCLRVFNFLLNYVGEESTTASFGASASPFNHNY